MLRSLSVLFVLCLVLSIPAISAAMIFRVDSTAGETGDGLSWATSFNTIQKGIDAAAAGGGEVWVKAGVYSDLTPEEVTDSFEALNPNAVDVIGDEQNMQYTAGGVLNAAHLNVLYLTGDVTQSPTPATFGQTTCMDPFATRLTALTMGRSDVLVFLAHPSFRDLTVVSNEDVTAAVNAGSLHAIEISMWGTQQEIDDVAKWDYALANLDDQASGCAKILWALRADDSHYIADADCTTHGVMMGSIPTAADDPVYSNRRLALRDMIRRGSMLYVPKRCTCGMPSYVLSNSDGSACSVTISLFVGGAAGATSANLRFYGCNRSTGANPGTLLFDAPVTLNASNSVTYFLTQTGLAEGAALTNEQKALIKYVRPALVWTIGGQTYTAYFQPVRITSSGSWWDGPLFSLANGESAGPSPYPSMGETVYFNTHSHTLRSDGDSTPFLLRRHYWENYGTLDPNAPRFNVVTDHEAGTPLAPRTRSVIVLKEFVSVYGGFAGTEENRSERNWVQNLTIIDAHGAGRCVYADGSTWQSPGSATLDGFVIRNGIAINAPGGGLYNWECSPTIENCRFTNNASSFGGAVCNTMSYPIIAGCVFDNNSVSSRGCGGAMLDEYVSSPTITNCTFVSNQTLGGNQASWGVRGGAICCVNSSETISNSIIAFNSSGLRFVPPGSAVLRNNCVYGNTTNDYSGLSPGPNSISADPLFVDKANGNYHLENGSRCINAGTNFAPNIPAYDMDMEPRIWEPFVDIGADECWTTSWHVTVVKLARDGLSVDVAGAIVTAAFSDSFYVEADSRSSGIRVQLANYGLEVGMRVDITGVMGTNPDGERYIEATNADQSGSGSVKPMALPIQRLGGDDWSYSSLNGKGQKGIAGAIGLNNIGLLVRIFGKMTQLDASTFTLADGSKATAKVIVPPSVTIDPSWNYVGVTGISSCENTQNGLSRLLRVRDQNDIMPLL